MKTILNYLLIALLTSVFNHIHASDTLRIVAVGKVYSDSLVLRFAPADAISFETVKRSGIKIERAFLPKNADEKMEFTTLNTALKIQPESFWRSNFNSKDTMASLAAQLVFGKNTFLPNNDAAIQLQQQKDYQNSRFAYTLMAADQDARVANALGLRFVERNYQKTEKYVYRVTFNENPLGYATDTTWLLLDASEKIEKAKAPAPEIKLNDSQVELSWRLPKGYSFTGFNLYRSRGSAKPQKLNTAIIVQANGNDESHRFFSFKDSVQNYVKYAYFLVGIDAFGDASNPSESISVMTKDMSPPPAAQILKAEPNANGKMKIDWDYVAQNTDLDGFRVHRAASIDGDYQAISTVLPKSTRSFIDTAKATSTGRFYKILSLDTAQNGSWSLPLYGFFMDSIPPAPPLGLKAIIDTNSIVTLTWDAGLEPDLQGYRVYYSNATDHRFTLLTGHILADTIYRDTIQKRSLTREIFYRVVAVDRNSNHSKPCQFVKVKRLDVIPPDAAVFKEVFVKDSTVILNWINSTSPDLANIRLLYRLQNKQDAWAEIKSWNLKDSVSTFKTKDLKGKEWYEFSIESEDSTGLKSVCAQPAQIRTYDTGIRPGISKLSANYDASNKSIKLKWNESFPENTRFLIYRNIPNGPGLSKYKYVNNTKEFVDKGIIQKGDYAYTLKVLFADGSESLPAETISINIQ
jgi:uncharacterized protein